LRFEKISIEEAQTLSRERKQRLESLKQLIQTKVIEPSGQIASYTLIVNGQKYEVSVERVSSGVIM